MAAGGAQYPVGLRFGPKNREVVRDFLWPKIFGRPIPTDIIQEAHIYAHHPDQLAAAFRPTPSLLKEWWFVARVAPKHSSGDRRCRITPFGRWVITQKAPAVTDEHGREIGKKRSLYFQVKRDGVWVKTNWLMEEFSCRDPELLRLAAEHYPAAQCDASWVVCRIYLTPTARPKPSSVGKRRMEDVPSSTSYGHGSVQDHPSTDFVEMSGLSSVDPSGKGKMVAVADGYGEAGVSFMAPEYEFDYSEPVATIASQSWPSRHDQGGLRQGHGAITLAMEETSMKQVWTDVDATVFDTSTLMTETADGYGKADVSFMPSEVEFDYYIEPVATTASQPWPSGHDQDAVVCVSESSLNKGLVPLDQELSSGLRQSHSANTLLVEKTSMEQVWPAWADVNAADFDTIL